MLQPAFAIEQLETAVAGIDDLRVILQQEAESARHTHNVNCLPKPV
jgi:hypothetical protein